MAQIFTFLEGNKIYIKVDGRVSFALSEGIINFLDSQNYCENWQIFFDMSTCASMDSTFMGTLAQIGLDIESISANLTILNISDSCYKLLEELGLDDFFSFSKKDDFSVEWKELSNHEISQCEQQEFIYKAHETLVNIYEPNETEFRSVLECLKPDSKES